MRTKHWIGTTLCLGALVAVGTAALQEQDKKPIPAASPEEAAMMAKWMEFATPGPAHKVLEAKIGKWTGTVKMFMPGAPPQESKFTSEAKWIMEGRYVEETVVGETPMGPFNGKGTTGYDNIKKKYVSTWIDNSGTGIYFHEGTYDPASKTFTYTGDSCDSTMTKYVKGRSVEKLIDNDHGTIQAFAPGPDGKETMTMEINYMRAK